MGLLEEGGRRGRRRLWAAREHVAVAHGFRQRDGLGRGRETGAPGERGLATGEGASRRCSVASLSQSPDECAPRWLVRRIHGQEPFGGGHGLRRISRPGQRGLASRTRELAEALALVIQPMVESRVQAAQVLKEGGTVKGSCLLQRHGTRA